MKRGMTNIVVATGLIIVGILLLLANLEIVSLEIKITWENIYPFLLLAVGMKLWLDALLHQGGFWILGSFLFVFSSLLILDRFGVIDFAFGDLLMLWPLLFIYIGFSIFLKGNKTKQKAEFHYEKESETFRHSHSNHKPKSSRMAIGSQEYKKDNWKVEPMNLWNGIGDYHFDFTKAFIPDGDTPIIVRGWIGDVKMLIPKNIPFRVEAKMKTGDIKVMNQDASGLQRELTYETEDYKTASRRLSLYIDYSIGSINVEQV
ncbi:cell wall-active antibiotics response protein LiaF [Halobacillus seohaensis]|uniref:Cell wall-active antibiotics response protein LiaF n=1 Tax=Halobacillus seohaensis TaxID=447421 RepID=A0ABW2EPX1_9BACI